MKEFPEKLSRKLQKRKENVSLRILKAQNEFVDFSSNDYLGLGKSKDIFDLTHRFLIRKNIRANGATGSRLLSGNHELYQDVEKYLIDFHQSEAGLIFNSGYDANIGFFSAVPQRGDIIFYDEFIHASIRDGIQLSNAKAYKFKHNDLNELEKLMRRYSEFDSATHQAIYLVTESVFSMDGDSPDLVKMSKLASKYSVFFIVDEAHAVGVFGNHGCGKIQELHLETSVFARIVTFGKALGCHGAIILGSKELQQYLVNFARSFIYTTALSPHSLATIKTAYEQLVISSENKKSHQQKLVENIEFFSNELQKNKLQELFIKSHSAIHCCVISGNKKVKHIAKKLQEKGFDIKAVLSPTIPIGQERLRFCLHSYNTKKEMSDVLHLLSIFVK